MVCVREFKENKRQKHFSFIYDHSLFATSVSTIDDTILPPDVSVKTSVQRSMELNIKDDIQMNIQSSNECKRLLQMSA